MAQAHVALPLDPLLSLARRQNDGPDAAFSDKEFARMIGVSARTVARWRAAGDVLPWPAADEAATRLGEHADRIWGEDWRALDADILAPVPEDPAEAKKRAKVEKAIAAAMDQIGTILEAESKENHGERIAS